MATWENYNSLIQLGVGLNFGYAVIEAGLRSRFKRFISNQNGFVARIKEPDANVSINPVLLVFIQGLGRAARLLLPRLFSIGVYVGFILGIVCIGFLVHASDHATDSLSVIMRIIVIICSAGWAGAYVIVVLFFRAVLGWGANKLKAAA
jgi:hypothetical protein